MADEIRCDLRPVSFATPLWVGGPRVSLAFLVSDPTLQTFALWLPWLRENLARFRSSEGVWLEFHQHQRPGAAEQVHWRE